MAHQTNNVKQFLDKAGVEALWERIYNGFAPRWQSYKPSNNASSATDDDGNRLPADFINTYESDHIVNGVNDGRKSLNVTFVSAGAIKDSNGNKYGRDLIVQIPEVKAPTLYNAGDGKYGVMSPEDKWKLDHVANTAEDKVTIKGVKVDNSKLTLTDKFVNWKLNYDTSTNELQIVDLNNSSTVVSRVDMDRILPDVITKGFLQEVKITNENDEGDKGLFLKLTFATALDDGNVTNASEVYINVNDLVDVYNAGTGISITQSTEPTADGEPRTSTINLKTAETDVIGGVKVYKDNSLYEVAARTSNISGDVTGINHRNFGVEIDKNDKAFVNVPITNITINDPNPKVKGATISPVTGGSFDIITDYEAAAGVDGWVLTPTTATINVNKETNWSAAWPQVDNKDVTGDDNKTLEFGKPFKVFKDIVADGTNGHGAVKSVATLTMPTETTLVLPDETKGADNNITTEYTNTTEKINDIEDVPVSHQSITITTSMVKSVDNHTIVRETTDNKFDICIPAIELSFIDALVYRVQ